LFHHNRFGDGYTILIRTNNESNTNTVINYIREHIVNATVREAHNTMIHFRVPTDVPLHHLFSVLEKARDSLGDLIEDYTVTQVTLDDVFVNLAQEKSDQQSFEHSDETGHHHWWEKTWFYRICHRKQENARGKNKTFCVFFSSFSNNIESIDKHCL
jgi:hypothetical protein